MKNQKSLRKKNFSRMRENFQELNELTAISPIDGRYRSRTAPLAPFVSESGLVKARFEVEAKYLVALSDVGVVRPLEVEERQTLLSLGQNITLDDAREVKRIEEETRHDVKAMERAFRGIVRGSSLDNLTEMIHLGLTSEDVNNLAYRLMLQRGTNQVCIPMIDLVIDDLVAKAEVEKATPMLARTHGQAAVPTTVGKELIVFATRLNEQVRDLERRPLRGKLTGAVGNFNALHFVHPEVNWVDFSEGFVRSLGFEPNMVTTQINPYEDIIEYLQNIQRINGVVIDLDQDMWRYVSDVWLVQERRAGEVGSSTMPQKVNPIDFENSEGNVQVANSLIEGLVRKLATSRLQRDLSDSTSVRNIGSVLAYSLIGYGSTLSGLGRVHVNHEQIAADLSNDFTILTEAVQTLLRVEGVADPYSMVASLSRGEHINQAGWQSWVDSLPINDKNKDRIRDLTPETYVGLATQITEEAIRKIRKSRIPASDN